MPLEPSLSSPPPPPEPAPVPAPIVVPVAAVWSTGVDEAMGAVTSDEEGAPVPIVARRDPACYIPSIYIQC